MPRKPPNMNFHYFYKYLWQNGLLERLLVIRIQVVNIAQDIGNGQGHTITQGTYSWNAVHDLCKRCTFNDRQSVFDL